MPTDHNGVTTFNTANRCVVCIIFINRISSHDFANWNAKSRLMLHSVKFFQILLGHVFCSFSLNCDVRFQCQNDGIVILLASIKGPYNLTDFKMRVFVFV